MFEKVLAQRAHKTIYKDGDSVIKVFDECYSKANVLNEALNQARIEETGLNIPKIREVSKIDGKWAITLDYIEGVTLASLMEQNPDKTEEYLERFVTIQCEILSKKCRYLNKLRDKMTSKIEMTDLDATAKYDLNTRLAAMPRRNKVCHGDFNPSNIIITPDDRAYILDWSHATQGNASADAARTYLLFRLANAGYADRYLEIFCAKHNISLKYVQNWLPIVAASQSVKGNAHEREFLQRWIDVVDYD